MRRRTILLVMLGGLIVSAAAYMVWSWYFSLPIIARGLSSNFNEANAEFKRRVALRYPDGMREEELARQLSADGFGQPRPSPNGSYVEINRGLFPCDQVWRIFWRREGGHAIQINASYAGISL
jgi:hypothetical protein